MDCDILVIGAGVLGLSSAYHLKERNPRKRVVLIDRFPGPGQGNTGKSNACFRNVFASETNFLLADSTIDWFKCLEDEGHDLKLSWVHYLWLYSESQYGKLGDAFRAMDRRGVEFKILDQSELKEKIPDLATKTLEGQDSQIENLEPVDVGVLGMKCGCLDADLLCRAYESKFLRLGGEVQYSTTASELNLKAENPLGIPGEPFVWQKAHTTGAKTNRGEIKAKTTIVAAGAWSEALLAPVGMDPAMRTKKRQLFVFKDPKLAGLFKVNGLNDLGVLPMTILPMAGVHFKTEPHEGSCWLGCADNLGRAFEFEDDPQPEEGYYLNNIYHILREYFPCFTDIRPVNMWAGQYEINSFDEIPVVASFPGMIYVGASSGSGLMKCDALGRIVSALSAGDEYAELYGGKRFRTSDLGLHNRRVDRETFIL